MEPIVADSYYLEGSSFTLSASLWKPSLLDFHRPMTQYFVLFFNEIVKYLGEIVKD